MKAKDIIKQYCSNNKKVIVGLCFLMLASIILLIGVPILMRYIIEILNEIIVNNTSISNYNSMILSLNTNAIEGMDTIITSYRENISSLQNSINSKIVTEIILVVSLGLCGILNFYVNLVLDKKISSFGSNIAMILQKNCYSNLLRSELYETKNLKDTDIENTIINDTEKIGNKYFGSHILKLVYYGLCFLAALITLFCFNPMCGLIVLITNPIIYVITRYISKIIAKKENNHIAVKTKQTNELAYNINNLKGIKIRNGIQKEEEEFNLLLDEKKNIYNSETFFKSINNYYLNTLICDLAICGFMAMFIWNVSSDVTFKLGNVFAILITTPIAYHMFKQLIDCYTKKQSIKEAYKNINAILELRPESRSETIASLNEIHTLSFNNVSFEYSALNQGGVEKINFELKKGEKLGILGYQKSGKTTVADLISKIVRPRFGNVLINNCDINKLNTTYLRDIIAYVPQDFNVFDGTVEQNIVYPMDLDEYRYNEALNKCRLKTLLMNLPKRDQENVLDIKLSPADIEKIGLAYAMYKDSPIMILDEATNKLDQVSENEIMQEFYKLKNKMIIVVSNRISTLMKCDKILIINEGKVVEYGKTEDLMNDKRSTYSKMINDVNRKIV